jgi:hypothetical protein
MATRMQQRRGTAAQWTSADPILAAGEIGFESDTGFFKMGDGTNHWSDLSYFKDLGDLAGSFDDYVPLTQKGAADGVATLDGDAQIPLTQLANLIYNAPTTLDTLGEIAAAIDDTNGLVNTAIDQKISDTLSMSILGGTGLTKTYDVETNQLTIDVDSTIATDTDLSTAISDHNSDSTNVHGITDTANLVYTSALTSGLAGKQDVVSGVSSTEIGYLDGVTSAIQTQIDAKLASATAASTYAPLASPALTGVPTAPTAAAGTNTTQVATTAFVGTAVADLVASAPSALNTLDELAAALGDDANFATTVTNSIGAKAPIANPTFTGTVTVSSSGVAFTDGTQTNQGVPSITAINQQAGAYTPVLADRDKLVEVSNASGVTVTIPTNASVAYPVGTSIDILQTGAGQVTIAGAGGVTVNATPGLKLRTQWSSATLFKRATDTWVVFGDLTA